MKTKSILITLGIILPLFTFSQVGIGTRHGIVVSTLSAPGDIYDNDELYTAYTGGIFAKFNLKESFYLQPEINYSIKGRKTDANDETTLRYLQVPILAGFNVNTGRKTGLYLNAGPYLAPLLNTRTELANGETQSGDETVNQTKNPDLGICLGGGITYPAGKVKLLLDLRYDMGLNKVYGQQDDFRTKALSLTAGIRF